MTLNRLTPVFLIPAAIFISSCGNNSPESETAASDSSAVQSVSKLSKAQNVFHTLASPVETASLIKKTGVPYNKEYLNPVENLSKYNTISSRALNLGVYGTDLSMASIFEQS